MGIAQFHTAPGTSGTHAIHADSSVFKAWATHCTVERGYIDIQDPGLGKASHGNPSDALGAPDGVAVVSLGDSGIAVIQFAHPIMDGPGYDFAIFENGFADHYIELAFVEISSDGQQYFRFPAICNVDSSQQNDSFQFSDLTKVHNFAGKYRALYGTPFDISDVPDHLFLNKNHITHIRLVDVVGSINPAFGSRDMEGKIINNSYPSPFPQSGFDLDAVGVIHFAPGYALEENGKSTFNLYPNPFNDYLHIESENPYSTYEIWDISGRKLKSGILLQKTNLLDLSDLKSGIYLFKSQHQCKAIIKN